MTASTAAAGGTLIILIPDSGLDPAPITLGLTPSSPLVPPPPLAPAPKALSILNLDDEDAKNPSCTKLALAIDRGLPPLGPPLGLPPPLFCCGTTHSGVVIAVVVV